MSASGTSPSWISQLLASIEAKCQAEFAAVEAAFGPAVQNIVTGIEVAIEDLAGFAFNAVLAEAPKIISGQEKFGNAVTNVVQTVEAQGKTVAIQTAQMAVQQAYIAAGTVAQNQAAQSTP